MIKTLEDELQENKMKVVELKHSGDGNQSLGQLHKQRASLDKLKNQNLFFGAGQSTEYSEAGSTCPAP